jgi:hypothetical protein
LNKLRGNARLSGNASITFVAPALEGWVWNTVTDPMSDGTTTILAGGSWRIIGPDDGNDNGWTYIKAQAPNGSAGALQISYDWSNNDGIQYDWPFYFVSSTEPPIETLSLEARGNSPGNIVSNNFQTGTFEVAYQPNDWIIIGVYSSDSVAGPGIIVLDGLPGTLIPNA